MAACSKYVAAALGREFVEPAPWTLEDVFPDTSCRVPTVFILSPGERARSAAGTCGWLKPPLGCCARRP